jgi:Legionella pneumophila major outer membrane protein precursor
VKRLCQWVLCLAVFGSSIALAADPASDAGGDGPTLGTAPASPKLISNLGANPIFITNATITTLNNGCSQPPPAGTGVTANTPAAPAKLSPAVTGVSTPAAPSKLAPAVTGVAASAPAASSKLAPAVTGVAAAPAAPVTQTSSSSPAPTLPVAGWEPTLSSEPTLPCLGDTCCENCCPHHGHIVGGAGVYLVQPYFENNPSYAFYEEGTGPGSRVDITQHMNVAPEIWLGYVGESGLGIRGRWWYFREDTNQTLKPTNSEDLLVSSAAPVGAMLLGTNVDAFNDTSKLQVQLTDLEVTQDFTLCNWSLMAEGGLRLVDITQGYNAFMIAGAGAARISSGSTLTAAGTVFGLEARRPLLAGFSLYGTVRGSVLFGSAKQVAVSGGSSDLAELTGFSQYSQDQVISIEEQELGVEYCRTVCRSRLFAQIGLIGQEWIGPGNASRSVWSSPAPAVPNFSTATTSNFGFFGLTVRFGVEF